ncbi:MAG: BREX-1 system phosphatase PglZ type A [Marinomonas sp.]
MNISQLTEGLKQAFFTEGHRLVFWYDPSKDFEIELDNLSLSDVTVLNMEGKSQLGIKLKLELEDKEGKYLLYFPSEEPDVEDDWLLDIKLYSRCFFADRISIIFNDLGLHQQSMRAHLALRDKFLGSKGRLSHLKKWLSPDANEQAIDLAMMAVLAKAEEADINHILFAIAFQAAEDDLGLESTPPIVDDFLKFNLQRSFVEQLQLHFGYQPSADELNGDVVFNFGRFMIRLLVTGFCENLGEIPDWAASQVLPSIHAQASVRALNSRWRDSSRYYTAFDSVSSWVSKSLNIREKIKSFSLESLAPVATFEAVEAQIIISMADAIPAANLLELKGFSDIVRQRRDNYWASRHKDDDTRKKYRIIYDALDASIRLFTLRKTHEEGFHYPSCDALYMAYQSELYQFDTAYRHYHLASQVAHIDLLKKLDGEVEQCYSHWFIDNLAKNWGDRVSNEHRLEDWCLSGIALQHQFYKRSVKPLIDHTQKKRVMVIISDAFRYEAAVELEQRVNEKRYSKATLSSQLGVVPSYTTLGMASLLPHNTLDYKGDTDDVLVDGLSSQGIAQRNKILQAHGGIAITAETLRDWSRDEGRLALKDQNLIYVYHNVVDAIGDVGATENRTFKAVNDAINELAELVRKAQMHFNTSTVIVTADHGFLFQQSKLDDADRTSLAEKPTNYIKSKKRYVIGQMLPEPKDALYGSTKITAGTVSDTKFWVPKGANRFHFVGGARFVHGGIMPQEIVVPVLTVKALRGENAIARTKSKVGVISAKPGLKMVNNIQSFDFLQTDSVDDRKLAMTAVVGIYDGQTLVSSEEVITFDSTSDSMTERVKKVRLSLQGSNFNRNNDYFLVIKDKDLETEIERYKVTIDLAFTDDFF